MKRTDVPRRDNGEAMTARVRYTAPEQGWREALQQCSHHPGGASRCQRPTSAVSSMCDFHAEALPSGMDATSFKHGRYSKAWQRQELAKRFEIMTNDETVFDTKYEVAAAQTLFEQLIETLDTHNSEGLKEALRSLDFVSKMQERGLRIQIERSAQWGVNEIRAFGQAIGQLASRMIRDDRDRANFIAGLRELMGGNDITALPETIDAQAERV